MSKIYYAILIHSCQEIIISMSKNITYDNSKKIIYIVLMNILSFSILYKLNIYIANYTNFYKWIIVKDIIGINIIVGFISIFSFFLYSYLYNDDYFHMFSLVYISIYFELVFMTFLGPELNISDLMETNKVFIGLASIFRTIIIWLAFYKQNSINKYLHNNKVYAVFLSIFITTICLLLDVYVMKHDLLNSHISIINNIKLIVNIFTYCMLIRLCILFVNKKSINYFITFIGTEFLFLSRILTVPYLYVDKSAMGLLNRFVLAIGFIIIIISMLLEIVVKAKENRRLTTKSNTQQIEINRLKQEDELRTQFFANISHELRTPLNILICSFQLLESKSSNNNELFEFYNKYKDTISTNSSRMLRLINNIIDASKFDSGSFKMNFINCDIISIIEEVTISIAKCEKAEKRNIIFDTDTEYLEMRCDPDNIERVFLNLLSNALKFTKHDGNINVICTEHDDYLEIKVIDDGIGIPAEFRQRIFDRFVQVDKSFRRNAEGSGIGLSIVKFIIDSHGGEVYLNDEIYNGCEFIIKLPKICTNENINVTDYIKPSQNELNNKVKIELSDIK